MEEDIAEVWRDYDRVVLRAGARVHAGIAFHLPIGVLDA
jgi:hypothetical protein